MVSTDIYVLTVKLKPLVLLLYLWKKKSFEPPQLLAIIYFAPHL